MLSGLQPQSMLYKIELLSFAHCVKTTINYVQLELLIDQTIKKTAGKRKNIFFLQKSEKESFQSID